MIYLLQLFVLTLLSSFANEPYSKTLSDIDLYGETSASKNPALNNDPLYLKEPTAPQQATSGATTAIPKPTSIPSTKKPTFFKKLEESGRAWARATTTKNGFPPATIFPGIKKGDKIIFASSPGARFNVTSRMGNLIEVLYVDRSGRQVYKSIDLSNESIQKDFAGHLKGMGKGQWALIGAAAVGALYYISNRTEEKTPAATPETVHYDVTVSQ